MVDKSISNSDAKDAQAVERPLAQTQERSLGRLKKDSEGVAPAPREVSPPAVTEAPATMGAKEEDRARQNVPAASPRGAGTRASGEPETAGRAGRRGRRRRASTTHGSSAAAAHAAMQRSPPRRRRYHAAQSERKQVEESAAMWLERIIKLRREGRHDEADAELKRFRERYPQVQLPAEALLPAGTR